MSREIIIKRYSPDNEKIWNEFVRTSKNPLFMFDRNYMDYHSDRFHDHSLIFYDEDKIAALLPANEKESVLYSHGGLTYGGLILDNRAKQHTVNDCMDALITYTRTNGIRRILYKPIPHIYHEQPAEEDKYALYKYGGRLSQISASTVINLKNPIKMPKGRKAQINRAKREGVTIQTVSEMSLFDKFINMENEILEKRHNTRAVHSAEELFLLYDRFPEYIHLVGAFLKGDLIAGIVIYEYKQVVHTQYMAASDIARSIGALDLAVMTVIEMYRGEKLWLDFGISTENGGWYLNEGLISQKEGFGGRTNVYEIWEIFTGSS